VNFVRGVRGDFLWEALILLRVKSARPDSANLEDAPFMIRSGISIALGAATLVHPDHESAKWDTAETGSKFLEFVFEEGRIPLAYSLQHELLESGQPVDTGGLGVEEVGDASLLLQGRK